MPVLAPAILAGLITVFVRLLASFEAELYLGFEKGIFVYTTRVWFLTGFAPTDFPQAMSLSSVFMVIIFAMVVLQWRMIGGKQFTTVTGRGFTTRVTRLGRWKYVTLGVVLTFIVVMVVLPLGGLVMGSFMKVFGLFTGNPWTLSNWSTMLKTDLFWAALKNTILLGAGAATIGTIIFALITYIVVRTKLRGRQIVDIISWVPWAVPGMVLALGFIWAYVGGFMPTKFLYGTLLLMILAFIVRSFPIGCRVMTGTMHQIGKELEESSRVLGGSWFQTFRRIIFPLIIPSAISVWIIVFLLCVADLATAVLLAGPESRVFSTVMFDYWLQYDLSRAMVVGVVNVALVLSVAAIFRLLASKMELPS